MIDLQLPEKATVGQSDSVRYFKADVSNEQDVKKATSGIVEWSESTKLDVAAIVCCAGYLGPAKVVSSRPLKIHLLTFSRFSLRNVNHLTWDNSIKCSASV